MQIKYEDFKVYVKSIDKVLPVYGFNRDKVFIDSMDSPEHGKNIFDSEDCILIRWTGFLDKNGKKIYEFDVLEEHGQVIFLNGSWVAGKIGSLVYLYAVHDDDLVVSSGGYY